MSRFGEREDHGLSRRRHGWIAAGIKQHANNMRNAHNNKKTKINIVQNCQKADREGKSAFIIPI
jgi:hypothetical protein